LQSGLTMWKRQAIATALALLGQQGTALAQSPLDAGSANNAMQGCRELVSQSNRHTELQRECASTVRTMMYVAASRGICPPDGTTVGHAVNGRRNRKSMTRSNVETAFGTNPDRCARAFFPTSASTCGFRSAKPRFNRA
jgi:hypothetical protein